ncbi:hypothetical protein M406DRAFT_358162 [Cryphonectria parasitica EP155]|uniref:Ubiquitin-like domain-containing protein n=1 Tax=Cryphonectria parasitica (strain ATCC 38755 / EP155) TaxID=660469 RepID=A0A9P4XVC0_CRYP1|nr:uncharacterized protein M406DRAFT_358162 [Cryphonectria parasitica EP155]KAF3761962.1 hypothetical protein M406DRAFT_358162 [Cryphonectria parasitica EP155]
MAKLAQLNNGTTQRQNGAFESEVTIRSALFYTRGAQLRLTKKGAEKQKKNQRRRERLAKKREKEEKEDDNASTTSSHTSGETVVGETPTVNHPPGTVESPPSGIAEITQVQDGVSGKGEPGNNSVESPKKLNVAMPVQDTKPDKNVKKNSPKKVSFTLSQMSQNLSDIMEEWTHRIFGRYDEFTRDWPSDELEAWVTRGRPYSVPIKVPFGHRRLQAGLKNINAVGKETDLRTFGRYIVGGPRTQYIVDDVVYAANKLQSRERVCLAFRELLRDDEADSFTVVFFSIQKEKAPILLTDVLGRKTSIPFELGKEWENIKDIILDLFVSVAEIGPHILEGHYDFFNVKGEIVLPRLWTDSVKPGDSINMRLWPMELNPLRRFYPQHPPFPFTSNKAESNNKEMERRAARLHNCIIGISPGPPGRAPHPARVGYSGEYPRGPRPAIRPPPPPAPVNMGRPPAMMPPPPMRPSMPPPPMRPSIPLRRTKPFRWQRNQLDGMSLAEDKELSFIDYVSEAEKAKRVTIADLLTKFTFLTDVVGDKCLDEWSCDFSGSDSDSDSGTDSDYDSDSSSSSSGTHSIVDD